MTSPTRRALLVALAAGLAGAAARAGAQELPEFNKLRTPTSPAFVILGITPAQVERPNRPGVFAASFLQQLKGVTQGTGLPDSYAVEIAPYWLRSHPGMSFDEYAKGGAKSLYRDASISFAVTDSLGDGSGAPEEDAKFRRLGFGLRTTLWAGRVHPKAATCVADVARGAARVAALIAPAIATDSELVSLRRRLRTPPTTSADTALLDSIRTRAEMLADATLAPEAEQLQGLAKKCTERLSARHGFNVDAAIATAVDFPGGRANDGDFGRFGVWVTPAWLGESFSHIGVARLSVADSEDEGTVRTYDLGLRSVYAWQRFAVSAEAVYRRVDQDAGDKNFSRLAAIFDAKLTDQTWLTVTVGKDFDPAQPNSMLALFGLKWQLGEQRVKPDIPVP